MITCLCCKNTFDEPVVLKETHYELEDMPFEEIPLCPYCFDSDIIRSDEND